MSCKIVNLSNMLARKLDDFIERHYANNKSAFLLSFAIYVSLKEKASEFQKSPRLSGGSGRRGSNPRPSAWKADALPTELLPQFAPFFQRGCKDITFCDMPYRLLIIFSASSAEIGEIRLKVFPSLSITSSNMVLRLTHMPLSPYMA